MQHLSLLRKANNVSNSYLLGIVLYTMYSNPRYVPHSSLLGMVYHVEYFSLLGIVRPMGHPSLLVHSSVLGTVPYVQHYTLLRTVHHVQYLQCTASILLNTVRYTQHSSVLETYHMYSITLFYPQCTMYSF